MQCWTASVPSPLSKSIVTVGLSLMHKKLYIAKNRLCHVGETAAAPIGRVDALQYGVRFH
jgi:hypothetical protein